MKQAIGTAYEKSGAASPVWFTVGQGILNEVYYPTVDAPQVGDLEFLITDGESYFSEEKRDARIQVRYLDEGMAVQVRGVERGGNYSFNQQIVTDRAAPVVRIRTQMHLSRPGLRLFILLKPAIHGQGAQNLASAGTDALVAAHTADAQHATYAAVMATLPWGQTSAGYAGFSDGWQDLSRNFKITQTEREAGPGNVVLVGELQTGGARDFTYELALSFGASRSEAVTYGKTSLAAKFDQVQASYEQGWRGFLASLEGSRLAGDRKFMADSAFARRSAVLIKMHEDKRTRGAIVAGLCAPGIPDGDQADDGIGGYHLVWPRDLYHAAMGLLAAGDAQTPLDVLHYYVTTQKPDGSWAQNFHVNGHAYWDGLQMDEVSFPILLAAQAKKRVNHALSPDEIEMTRKAAAFIVGHGPKTGEDRWEEMGGYVPSTLAAEIAALRLASQITGDGAYAQVAEDWQTHLESWTLVQHGPHGDNYYLRASPGGNPNIGEEVVIANGSGPAKANELLDGGFLDLVRMDIRDAHDPRIASTLAAYDSQLGSAGAYRRYSRDGYGPAGKGGFWPLLAGERGDYAVAVGDVARANAQLALLERSATATGLIPEQTKDSAGQQIGAGVATPLVWAHAEDLLLHRSAEDGRLFDSPVNLR